MGDILANDYRSDEEWYAALPDHEQVWVDDALDIAKCTLSVFYACIREIERMDLGEVVA